MITILAVGPDAEALAAFGASHPSIEVVTAHGAEDALERLARNRRIDAVLLLDGRTLARPRGSSPRRIRGLHPCLRARARRRPRARGAWRPIRAARSSEELLRALSPEPPQKEKGG